MGIKISRDASACKQKIFAILGNEGAVGNIVWDSPISALTFSGIVGFQLVNVNPKRNEAYSVLKALSAKDIIVGYTVFTVDPSAFPYSYVCACEGRIQLSEIIDFFMFFSINLLWRIFL